MLLVCRFRIPSAEPQAVEAFLARARRALELLTAQPGCRHASVARALDDADAWLLVAEFESVTAYRRALSPFDVREHVVPLLAEADPAQPSTFERLLVAAGGDVTERSSLIAEDAGQVRVGEAAGPTRPR